MATTLTMGYKPGSLARGAGELTTGMTRITYLGKATQPLWVVRGGARMGRNQSATAWGAVVLFGAPTDTPPSIPLIARTNTMALTVLMNNDRATGQNYEGAAQTSELILPGTHLWSGVWSSSGDINFGQNQSGALMRTWDGDGGSPPSAIVPADSRYHAAPEGAMDVWWVFETNDTPGQPLVLVPANGSMTSDTSPDITIKFVDGNAGDQPSKYLIELYDEDNSTALETSSVQPTNATQKSEKKVTWNPGVIDVRKYTIRSYFWDRANAKSPARTTTFTINAGGSLVNLGLAAGEGVNANGDTVYNDTTPDWIVSTWTHESGEDMASIESRVVNDDTDAVVRNAVTNAAVIAAGNPVQINWITGWAALPRGGTRYAWEVRGTDALGGITDWVRSDPFVINAFPTLSDHNPPDNATQTVRPLLTAKISDANDGDGSHIALFIVNGENRPGSHQGGGVYAYQTTAADLPAPPMSIAWNMAATDPWGNAAATPPNLTFSYVEPPEVTITSPVGTISVGSPTISATVDRTLSTYRARIILKGTDAVVLDTETVAGSGLSISSPIPPGLLRNETDYRLHLEGTTSDTLTFSVWQDFRIEYPASPRLEGVTLDMVASSVFDEGQYPQLPNADIGWSRLDESVIDDANFIGYVVQRYDGLGKGREWLIRNREVIGMTDRSAGHGVHSWYVGYRHYVNAGADIIDSELVKVSTSVDIRHTVITHDESDIAVTFKFWRDRRVDQQISTEAIVPIGRKKPYAFQSATQYDMIRGVFKPLSEEMDLYTAQQIAEAARELAVLDIDENGVERPKPLWYRDRRGRVLRVIFDKGVASIDDHLLDRGELEVSLTEVVSTEIINLVEPSAVIDSSDITITTEGPPYQVSEQIYRGDDWHRQYQFPTEGGVLDTTGYTARMWIVEQLDDATPVLSSDDGEIVLTVGPGGTAPNQYGLDVFIPGTNTIALPVGFVGWYDIELTSPEGHEETYVFGPIRAEGEATP